MDKMVKAIKDFWYYHGRLIKSLIKFIVFVGGLAFLFRIALLSLGIHY